MSKVKLTVNKYDIPMLEIPTKTRPVFISVKKAVAVLATNENPNLIEATKKHGRDLFRVDYGDGKGFTMGETKISAVLDNKQLIEKAIA